MSEQIYFIINPRSGTRRIRNLEKRADRILQSSPYRATYLYTEYPGHGKELAAGLAAKKAFAVIAVGGDGTINEVGSALVNTETRLGIVPNGSGNGFARYLKIPMQFEGAMRVIISGAARRVDTCTINGRVFINVAGMGFDAAVSRAFEKSGLRGLWSYVGAVISELRDFKTSPVDIEADGKLYHFTPFIMAFANGKQYGNNAVIAPAASADDGYLNLSVIEPFPALSTPGVAFSIMNGTVDRRKHVKTITAKNISVNCPEGEIDVHIDGEYISKGKSFDIRIHSRNLVVLAPILNGLPE